MATVYYLRGALGDLDRLTAFLLENAPLAAKRTAGLIRAAVNALEGSPLIGRPTATGLRELVISRGKTGYVALYRFDPEEDRVLVAAIRHQREAGFEDG